MILDIILISLGFICILVGFAGCILPVLPGIPLSYLGIVLLHFTSVVNFSPQFLIVWGIVVIVIQVLDYFIPIWGTKYFGGGKKGMWGSLLGIVLGVFILPPWGIIIFPFVGAVIGELIDEKEFKEAMKAGFGAFLGFLVGTVAKLVVAAVLAFYFVKEVIVSIIPAFV
ncbi:DUF456 domain-containing protein [Dysgonomonas sp. Marseille-P4361]|uniref:DUF456 domain-containing protein n=1 Tax=Dysgonomonas sp. Marseille-P4361 TaxID=2161820 RepID=UPI000D55498C|nr:DUF456 domain-containing protein [Dysgonomonas sp. Marseille-P4361]